MTKKTNNPYAKEKFYQLVSGLLDCSYRTKGVVDCLCILVRLNNEDFSEKQKPLWNEIQSILTSEKPTYNSKGEVMVGNYENSINTLDEIQYSNLMEKILSLYFSLRGYENYQSPL